MGFINAHRDNPLDHWTNSYSGSALIFMMQPPNALFRLNSFVRNSHPVVANGASSAHGGVHLLIGDGSVRFVKETVNCWPIRPNEADPAGSEQDRVGLIKLPPNGVWQALATRAGGEVINADDF